jgi:hypothetical protein
MAQVVESEFKSQYCRKKKKHLKQKGAWLKWYSTCLAKSKVQFKPKYWKNKKKKEKKKEKKNLQTKFKNVFKKS